MDSLKFVDYILDNIHGYIPLTEMESRIEKLPIFRRLRGIKQLGLTNWIFPGAEHTRYSHSLGVMHIADKIAVRLGFSKNERQLIRVAGMLHDIGHYPLSHVGERAYKRKPIRSTIEDFAKGMETDDCDMPAYITHSYMAKSSNPFHHEAIGEAVIRASSAIRHILDCNGIDVNDVCAIITGDIKKTRLIKFVQILHCEMDADRIDYLLRDTFSSGTAYGAFEINTLIKNMAVSRCNEYDVDIIGVNAKGVMSADQFLINRYFAYTQVFYHKHVSALSLMGEELIYYFMQCGAFPGKESLLKIIENHESDDRYYNFTDSLFLNAAKSISPHAPEELTNFANHINQYRAPDIMPPQEHNNVVISSASNRKVLSFMEDAGLFDVQNTGGVLKIDQSFLTEHVSIEDYKQVYRTKHKPFKLTLSMEEYLKHRLINGVAFIQKDGSTALLYDTPASLTKDLCRHRTIFFRTYKFLES